MDHHELGPGGSSPPTKRAKLDSATSETAGKPGGLDDLQIIGERRGLTGGEMVMRDGRGSHLYVPCRSVCDRDTN